MGYGFSKSGAQRVVNATKFVEKRNRSGSARDKLPTSFVDGNLWAQITEPIEGNKYKWIAFDDTMTPNSEWGSYNEEDDNYAVEVTGFTGVYNDYISYLYLNIDNGIYRFEYSPGVLVGTASEAITSLATGECSSDGKTIDVYNPYSSEIAIDTVVTIGYEKQRARFIILGADCEEEV